MNWLEKEFQKRFYKEKSEAGINKEQLWQQISTGMTPVVPPTGEAGFLATSLKSVTLWIGIGSAALLGGAYLVQESIFHSDEKFSEMPAALPESEVVEFQSTDSGPISTEITIEKALAFSSNAVEDAPPFLLNREQKETRMTQSSPDLNKKSATPITVEHKDPFISAQPQDDSWLSVEEKSPELISLPSEKSAKSLDEKDLSGGFAPAALSPLKKLKEFEEKNTLQHFSPRIEVLKQPKGNWETTLFAGSNWTLPVFGKNASKSDLGQWMQQALSPEFGNTLAIHVRYDLSGSPFYLAAGLEYWKTENRLDWRTYADTLVFREDVSSEWIKAKKIRTVRHHNKLEYLNIPLEVGYSGRHGNWEYGGSLGGALALVQMQKGKILKSKNDILAYDGEKLKDFRDFFFSIRTSPFAQYNLSEFFGIRFQTTVSYQLYGASEITGVNQSSLSLAPGIGVVKRY